MMIKRLLVLASVIVGLATAAVASFNPISLSTYGAPDRDYYLSVVALQMKIGNGVVGCTGTLIHDLRPWGKNIGFVLTAAHCVKDAEAINVGFYPDSSGHGAPVIRPARHWRWPQSFNDKSHSGEMDLNVFNADQVHDWAVVMVDNLPAHIKPMKMGQDWKQENMDSSIFLVARDSQEKSQWISPLWAVPFQDSLPFGDLNKTHVWRSSVVQPEDPNGLRGICMGNSGGPVVRVVNGHPVLIGIVSAEADSFPVIGNKKTFLCGRLAYWYNATLAIPDFTEAMKLLQREQEEMRPAR